MNNQRQLGAAAVNQTIPLGYDANDFLVYHWSPSLRRKSIARKGLVPGKISVEKAWKPPFICFSYSPSLAWTLSAMRTDYDNQHKSWDLYMAWAQTLGAWEMIPFDDGSPREYRVYRPILRSEIWFVGTRTLAGEKEVVSGTL